MTMFRAFLKLDKEEIEEMSLTDYMENIVMLNEVLKVLHAPYINKE